MVWCLHEPTLQEILSDPITRALMHADRVEPREVEAMLRQVAQVRGQAGNGGGSRSSAT
jgi:hypothetical protein